MLAVLLAGNVSWAATWILKMLAVLLPEACSLEMSVGLLLPEALRCEQGCYLEM